MFINRERVDQDRGAVVFAKYHQMRQLWQMFIAKRQEMLELIFMILIIISSYSGVYIGYRLLGE